MGKRERQDGEYEALTEYTGRRSRRFRWTPGRVIAALALLSALLCLGRILACREDGNGGLGLTGGRGTGDSYVPLAEGDGEEPGTLSDEDKLREIQDHPEAYPERLRELAKKNSETMNYVYQYPSRKDQSFEIDLSAEAAQDTVPLLLQWDERWGYLSYGDGLIGYTGCGPTCLSMVALYLTGDPSATPAAIAEYAQSHGYYINGSGTDWSMLRTGCEAFGIQARELPLNQNTIIAALAAGQPVICALRAGDFTDGGHFIVLTGYADGAFTVNDPNSPQRSATTWSYERLEGQIKNLWSYSKIV